MTPWRVARSLEQLREQVNAAAPNRSKASDGSVGDAAHRDDGSASDHNPWVDGNVVTAIDITHDPANGCDVWAIGQAIAASRDRRLKYQIWTGQAGGRPGILSSKVAPWTWRTRPVDDHPHHLHVSVMPDRALYDSAAKWALTPARTTAAADTTLRKGPTMLLIKGADKPDVAITNGLEKRHIGPGEVKDLLRMTRQTAPEVISQGVYDRMPNYAASR